VKIPHTIKQIASPVPGSAWLVPEIDRSEGARRAVRS
jgi:hypothetical protein